MYRTLWDQRHSRAIRMSVHSSHVFGNYTFKITASSPSGQWGNKKTWCHHGELTLHVLICLSKKDKWRFQLRPYLVDDEDWYMLPRPWSLRCQVISSYDIAFWYNIDGLVQEILDSIAKALELGISCSYPSICFCGWYVRSKSGGKGFGMSACFKQENIYHLINLEICDPTWIIFTVERDILGSVMASHPTYPMHSQVYEVYVSASEANGNLMYVLAATRLFFWMFMTVNTKTIN